MKRDQMKIEYTPEQSEAYDHLRALLERAEEVARRAGAQRFAWALTTGKGSRFECVYSRREDPSPTPYAVRIETSAAATIRPAKTIR